MLLNFPSALRLAEPHFWFSSGVHRVGPKAAVRCHWRRARDTCTVDHQSNSFAVGLPPRDALSTFHLASCYPAERGGRFSGWTSSSGADARTAGESSNHANWMTPRTGPQRRPGASWRALTPCAPTTDFVKASGAGPVESVGWTLRRECLRERRFPRKLSPALPSQQPPGPPRPLSAGSCP